VESLTLPDRSLHRTPRPWLAVVLGALVSASSVLVPSGINAQPAAPAEPARLAAAAVVPAVAGADQPDVSDPADHPTDQPADAPTDGAPTIQYLQAEEHAGDHIDFAPGDEVSVPFTPRRGDSWQVDGAAPRNLPAGQATGAQMRAEQPGSVWAAGAPPGLADHGAGSSVDQPSATDGAAAIADPASVTVPSISGTATNGSPVSSNGLRREVFGFLPYWVIGDSSTVLDWRTLSTVAYFSVGCESNGTLDKTNPDGSLTTGWAGWTSSKMTSLINAAHQNQTRVVLTVSCFAWGSAGAARQAKLLASSTARATLARAIAAAVRDRGADGVNLDYEPIVAGYSAQFTALVRSIRAELNRVAPGYQLTFDTTGVIGNYPIADATAPGGADAVFIMGYDYRTSSSSVAGSISPLTGPHYDLTDTVKAYTARISPSKVILGVPYYGRAWSTASSSLNAATLSQSKYGSSATPTYAQAFDYVAAHGRRYDTVEQAPWTAYRKTTCTSTYGCVTSWRELYYDDAASLGLRYDLVNRTDLRGAGIWALGYDGTRADLRDALAAKFLADRTPPTTGIVTLATQQHDERFRVAWTGWDDSGIRSYDVQVSVNGGAWVAWLTATTATSALYPGVDGRTYAFRVRATDVHGNASAWRSLALGTLGTPDSIAVGGFATVLVDGMHMRTSPATDASVMATLDSGAALQVIGGPVSGEGYTWWQVSGPVQQWAPVDPMQIGGWIAASGNGTTNASPRRPVYATVVHAGITGLRLGGAGGRVVTSDVAMPIAWTNQVDFDSLTLRAFRTDGTVAGSLALGATGAGSHVYSWDGRISGGSLPNGTYILQLQGLRGSAAYSAPSASPASDSIKLYGVIVADAAPTSVKTFTPPVSPTRATTLTWTLSFGGVVGGFTLADIARSGTALGCVIGSPVGAGASWSVTVTGCGQGTVILGIKARSVVDAVGNLGPATQVNAPIVRIDRTGPTSTAPRITLVSGVALPSTATSAALAATLTWSATDPGGAGVRNYDVRRSIDGAAYAAVVTGLPASSMAVTLAPGQAYRFEVRARDNLGNVGAWVAGPSVRAYLPQQTYSGISWKGTWPTTTDARYSGGSSRSAAVAGASVSYAFTGRAVEWVTSVGPSRGAAKVYIDGVLVATIDLYAPTASFLRVAYARTWSADGNHVIRIVVVGTAGRPRVDVDAFGIVR
jgi:spore germination protein YaaH